MSLVKCVSLLEILIGPKQVYFIFDRNSSHQLLQTDRKSYRDGVVYYCLVIYNLNVNSYKYLQMLYL